MRPIAAFFVIWLSSTVLASAQESAVKVPVVGWLTPATTESYKQPGAGRAAQAATKTVPIVCVADDLVDSGLAADLAKPLRNMTGVSILATELDTKKLELLKELLPRAKRFGVAPPGCHASDDRHSRSQ
jgi:hypothetical protein